MASCNEGSCANKSKGNGSMSETKAAADEDAHSHSHSHGHGHAGHSADSCHGHSHGHTGPANASEKAKLHGYHGHGHSHEKMEHPGVFEAFSPPTRTDFDVRGFTVGIGGESPYFFSLFLSALLFTDAHETCRPRRLW